MKTRPIDADYIHVTGIIVPLASDGSFDTFRFQLTPSVSRFMESSIEFESSDIKLLEPERIGYTDSGFNFNPPPPSDYIIMGQAIMSETVMFQRVIKNGLLTVRGQLVDTIPENAKVFEVDRNGAYSSVSVE